jgi:hypothetical protein
MLSSLFALCSPVDERLNPIRIMLHGDVTSFVLFRIHYRCLENYSAKKSIGFDTHFYQSLSVRQFLDA